MKPRKDRKIPLARVYRPVDMPTGKVKVTYQNIEGKRTHKYFTSGAAAHEYHEKLSLEISARKAAEAGERAYPDYDGKLSWFLNLMAVMAKELYIKRDKDDLQIAKGLAQIGMAAKQLYDQAALEDRMGEVEEKQREIVSHQKHAIRAIS